MICINCGRAINGKICDCCGTDYRTDEEKKELECNHSVESPCKHERAQGEWIGKEEYDDYPNKKVCECSECGKMICISQNDFPNFCENCGLPMKKGGAE